MPMAAAKPCTKAGCRALVRGGTSRCDAHPYDPRPVVSGSRDPFYNQARWRAASRAYRVKHPTCACGAPSRLVDHVIPRSVRPDLEWTSANWQAQCWRCASRKTAATDGAFGNPVVP